MVKTAENNAGSLSRNEPYAEVWQQTWKFGRYVHKYYKHHLVQCTNGLHGGSKQNHRVW